MADDVTLPGTGVVVASDDVGGVQYQKVKLIDATDGSSTPVGTTSNPLKVAEIEADCTTVLSTSLTTTGPTSSIDTTGYGAIVVQISGAWNGFINPEASNDGTTWDTVMAMSRDSLNLQDMITSGGLYTIRPSGKYVRLNVAQITGTAVVVAIGREAEGIAAADLLSLAMEPNNNAPLYVAPVGSLGRTMVQDSDGALVASGKVTNYRGTLLAEAANRIVSFPCDGYATAFVMLNMTGAAGATIELFHPDIGWSPYTATPIVSGASGLVVAAYTAVASGNVPYQVPLYGATYIRIRTTVGAAGNVCRYSVQLSPYPVPTMSLANVTSNAAGNLLCTNTPLVPTAATNLNSAATTNATSVKTSAGRIMALSATNNGAAVCFLKLYNKASAPTVGTDTPVQVLSIPANGVPLNLDCGALGLQFSTGIAYAITNLIGDADTTAIAANQVKLMMSYV